MATFDQLTAEQRAIIELVVRRGRSYESLADVLDTTPTRVRELAREALAELAPVTARRIDDGWRSQLADYVLGQQTGPESTATRGYLKRSEAARAWALSVIDSLDSLYGNGSRPLIPEGDSSNGRGGAVVETERPRERERDRAAERRREHEREVEREREREVGRERPREVERDDEPVTEAPPSRPEPELSPEARRALRRRRAAGVLVALVLVAGIVVGVLAATGTIFSSSKKHAPAAAKVQAVGVVPLTAQPGQQGNGAALLLKRGNQSAVVIQATGLKPAPTGAGFAYAVWLYNSPNDLASLGAQVTDAQGRYNGQTTLPANWRNFKFIDITYEKLGTSVGHNGPSVLRGAFANIQSVGAPAQGGAPTTTAPTTPTAP